jgi:hypothetical protein
MGPLCSAVCATFVVLAATGCGAHHARVRGGELRIDLVDGAFGPRHYDIHGTPPYAKRVWPQTVCRAVAVASGLLHARSGATHSCPGGPPTVVVRGAFDGERLDSRFSVCVGGQEQEAARWLQLLRYGPSVVLAHAPAGAARAEVCLHLPPAVLPLRSQQTVWHVLVEPTPSSFRPAFEAMYYKPLPIRFALRPGMYVGRAEEALCGGNCNSRRLLLRCVFRLDLAPRVIRSIEFAINRRVCLTHLS